MAMGTTNWSSTKILKLYRQRSNQKEARKKFNVNIYHHFPNRIFALFLSILNNLKNYGYTTYKIYLNSLSNRAMFKDIKLQNTNYFNRPISEHLPPFNSRGHILLISWWIWVKLDALIGGYNIFLSFKFNRRMSTHSSFSSMLNASWLTYLP